jgi:hypothetical protein
MTDIAISDITNSTDLSEGTGIFDVLIKSMERRIEAQYEAGRITGSNFANVYLGGLQTILTESVKFILSEQKASADADTAIAQTGKVYAEIGLTDQKQLTEQAQTTDPSGGLLGAKKLLLDAQTLGFASDTKQKVLKQMLDGYAVNLSISGTAAVPATTKEAAIDQLSQEVLTDVGSTIVIQSVTEVPDVD